MDVNGYFHGKIIWRFPKIGLPHTIIHFICGFSVKQTIQRVWGMPRLRRSGISGICSQPSTKRPITPVTLAAKLKKCQVNPREKWGYPIAGWFLRKIRKWSGWFWGTPILGNLHMYPYVMITSSCSPFYTYTLALVCLISEVEDSHLNVIQQLPWRISNSMDNSW